MCRCVDVYGCRCVCVFAVRAKRVLPHGASQEVRGPHESLRDVRGIPPGYPSGYSGLARRPIGRARFTARSQPGGSRSA